MTNQFKIQNVQLFCRNNFKIGQENPWTEREIGVPYATSYTAVKLAEPISVICNNCGQPEQIDELNIFSNGLINFLYKGQLKLEYLDLTDTPVHSDFTTKCRFSHATDGMTKEEKLEWIDDMAENNLELKTIWLSYLD